MKKIFVLLMLCIATTPMFAQTNIGIDYYLLGEYQKARSYFESQLSANPAQSYFYLGEIAFAEGDMARAAEFYDKCAAADPTNALCAIGQAKLKLKSDPKAAEAAFDAVLRNDKKNIDLIVAIGRAYLANGMTDKAMARVAAAKKIDNKAPQIYILEGDIIAAGGDAANIGEAAGKYEMAVYFDPDYRLGSMKIAQIYESGNAVVVIQNLKGVIAKYPDYMPAYEILSKVYTNTGYYPQAIELFKINPPTTPEDIERYARALYFSDNMEKEAQAVVTKGLREDPNNFVMSRYQLYLYSKAGNYNDGLPFAEKFFSLGDKSRYIYMDYTAYASLLKDAKRYNEAMAQFDHAINIEPDILERYKEAVEMASEINNYGKAADYYRVYIDKKILAAGEGYPDELYDISTLGNTYYNAGTTIAKNPELAAQLMKNSDLIKELLASDSGLNAELLANDLTYFTAAYSRYFLNKARPVFSTIIERSPDSYTGYRFKARTEYALNPDVKTSAAKDYYEKMVAIITAKEDISKPMITAMLEGYNYLVIYYYLTDNKSKAIEYANKVLELDPENVNAKAILEDLSK